MNKICKHFSNLTLKELKAIYQARNQVFIVEQNCPYLDIDSHDEHAYHLFFEKAGKIAAYARILPKGETFEAVSIGRVLTILRGQGLGNELLKAAIEVAEDKFQAEIIQIEAQVYAKGFYEKFGFQQTSEEFLEDDIPHIEMTRKRL